MKTLQIRIDEETKAQAQAIFSALGLDMSSAVRLFLRQVIEQQKIPFDIALKKREQTSPINQEKDTSAREEQSFLQKQELLRILEDHQRDI